MRPAKTPDSIVIFRALRRPGCGLDCRSERRHFRRRDGAEASRERGVANAVDVVPGGRPLVGRTLLMKTRLVTLLWVLTLAGCPRPAPEGEGGGTSGATTCKATTCGTECIDTRTM